MSDPILPAAEAQERLEELSASGWRGLPVPPLTSVSAVRDFQACERAWFYDRVVGLEAKDRRGGALATGLLVHEVLGALTSGADPGKVIRRQRELALGDALSERAREDAEAALALAEAVAANWEPWAAKQSPRLEVIQGSSERSFPADGESALRGRIDRVVRVSDGPWAGTWIEDFKTHQLGKHGERIARTPFDKQALTYVLETPGARGVVWSLIGKTASRRRQKETLEAYCDRIRDEYKAEPDKYFHRHFEALDGAKVHAKLAAVRMRHGLKAGMYAVMDFGVEAFEQNEGHCHSMGECPFLRLCQGGSTTGHRLKERR